MSISKVLATLCKCCSNSVNEGTAIQGRMSAEDRYLELSKNQNVQYITLF